MPLPSRRPYIGRKKKPRRHQPPGRIEQSDELRLGVGCFAVG